MIKIKIAGIPFAIENRYSYIETFCRGYITEEEPMFSVTVSESEIEAERIAGGRNFPDYVIEATCIHRAVVKNMVKYGIVLIHSAVVAVDGEAYVFMAKSGVGKSTHLKQWMAHFGDRAVIVNGDKPMFSFQHDRLMVYGSPWQGKEGWGQNISLPVRAFCLLERGEKNTIQKATQSEIIQKLFHQVLLPTEANDLAIFMPLINRMISELPFYRLECTISEEAATIAYDAMSKGEFYES